MEPARQVEPRAGEADFDIWKNIIGNWFCEAINRFEQWSHQLAFNCDVICGDGLAMSGGSVLAEGAAAAVVYAVDGNAPCPESFGVGDGLT